MTSSINVSYDGLQQASTQLKNGKEEITQKLQQLKGLVDQLTSGEFKTQVASGKFNESYQQFTTSATNLVESLDSISQYLNNVIQQHQQLDQSLAGGA
ncbi:MAG TPA: WXG100 family type VII secretion target [Jatrophihabitantaceae bacterium]|jgi:WXG100 family type VII secretion target